MLIAASWPSNNEAAVTKRSGGFTVLPDTSGKSVAAVLMDRCPPTAQRQEIPLLMGNLLQNQWLQALQKF
jgi:hypothetical protein